MPWLISIIAAGCAGTNGKNIFGTVDSGLATVRQTTQTGRAVNEAPPIFSNLNCKYIVLRISISCKRVSLSILINGVRFVFLSRLMPPAIKLTYRHFAGFGIFIAFTISVTAMFHILWPLTLVGMSLVLVVFEALMGMTISYYPYLIPDNDNESGIFQKNLDIHAHRHRFFSSGNACLTAISILFFQEKVRMKMSMPVSTIKNNWDQNYSKLALFCAISPRKFTGNLAPCPLSA
jgi:hypothetical protein